MNHPPPSPRSLSSVSQPALTSLEFEPHRWEERQSDRGRLFLDQNTGVVHNIHAIKVEDIERDFNPAFERSIKRRKVRGTKLNEQSSRTHYLLRAQVIGTTCTGDPIEGQLDLVDLAGNENTKVCDHQRPQALAAPPPSPSRAVPCAPWHQHRHSPTSTRVHRTRVWALLPRARVASIL